MRIEFVRKLERYIKGRVNRLFIHNSDFTIVSNNCWGTFIYKQYALPYNSPFVNLIIFAPDYLDLLENFSIDVLKKLSFIENTQSKYKDYLISIGLGELDYPIGILDNKYEIHFLHYSSVEEAKNKWLKRIDRINLNKMIFKFSDGDLFESNGTLFNEDMVERFDNLKFKNKVAFMSKDFPKYKSVITLEKFKGENQVKDEWKHSKKEFNVTNFLNNIYINEEI